MMPRKRCCAGGSSAAGPRSVSMKPISDASGVRSSWLTLATKSARMRSTARSRERSDSTTTRGRHRPSAGPSAPRSHAPPAAPAPARSPRRSASSRRRTHGRSRRAARDGAAPPACPPRTPRGRRNWRAERRDPPPARSADRAAAHHGAVSAAKLLDQRRAALRRGAPVAQGRCRDAACPAGPALSRHRFVRRNPPHAVRQQIDIARPAQRQDQRRQECRADPQQHGTDGGPSHRHQQDQGGDWDSGDTTPAPSVLNAYPSSWPTPGRAGGLPEDKGGAGHRASANVFHQGWASPPQEKSAATASPRGGVESNTMRGTHPRMTIHADA